MNSKNRDFRERFAETASTYRKGNALLACLVFSLLLAFMYVANHVPEKAWLAILLFIVAIAAMIFSKRGMAKPICPGCERDSDCGFVRFCPECGSMDVQKKGDDKYFLDWPKCQACGKELGTGRRGRSYKIRYCTRCGAYLDECGI